MGGPQSEVYVVHRDGDRKAYLDTVPEENTELECGEKSTAFLTKGIIPGFIGTVIYRIVNDQDPPTKMFWNSEFLLCSAR